MSELTRQTISDLKELAQAYPNVTDNLFAAARYMEIYGDIGGAEKEILRGVLADSLSIATAVAKILSEVDVHAN